MMEMGKKPKGYKRIPEILFELNRADAGVMASILNNPNSRFKEIEDNIEYASTAFLRKTVNKLIIKYSLGEFENGNT